MPAKSWLETTSRSPPVCRTQARLAPGGKLDVDEVRAGVPGLLEQRQPRLFGALEIPALPRRPAGHDDRAASALQRAGHVGVGHRVEPQLHQVRLAGGLVTPGAQLGQRGGGDDGAERREGNLGHKIKKPLAPVR